MLAPDIALQFSIARKIARLIRGSVAVPHAPSGAMVSTVKSCAHSSVASDCAETNCASAAATAPRVSANANAGSRRLRLCIVMLLFFAIALRAAAPRPLDESPCTPRANVCDQMLKAHHDEAGRAPTSSRGTGGGIQTYGVAAFSLMPGTC